MMKADEDANGALTITHDNSSLTKFLLGLAAVLLGTAAYDVFVGTRGTERLIALLASAAVCALSGIVTLETGHFRFDRVERTLRWRSRWGFRRRTGGAAFADISRVLVEVPIGDSGMPSRRICLRMTDETKVPITVGYNQDVGDHILEIADKIRQVLALPSPTTNESARDLVDRGQAVAAIRLLVEQEGLSLTEAKQRIDSMKATGSRGVS